MKKLSLILLCFFFTTLAQAQETLKAVSDPWCPYVCAKEEAKGREGYFVDAFKKAMAERGIEVQFQIIPYTRALKETKEGRLDALVGVNTEGKPEFIFSTPLGKTQSCFFVDAKNKWAFEGVATLSKVRFGVAQDYHYGDEIMRYIAENKENTTNIQILPSTTNLEQNIKKLMGKRIDTFVDDRGVVNWYLKNNNLKGKLKVVGCIKERDLVIAFPKAKIKRSKRFQLILNEEIEKMEKSGELEKMKSLYK